MRIIINPCLDVVEITDVHDIPKKNCNRIQATKSIQRHPICLIDAEYDYLLDEKECKDKIYFKSTVSVKRDEE